MQEMRGLEANDLERRQSGKLLPESRPETLRLDRDAREIADFLGDLGLVAEIRDEHDIALAHEEQRARPGETGQIANVGQARDEQPVHMGSRQTVGERRQSAPAGINHEPRSIG